MLFDVLGMLVRFYEVCEKVEIMGGFEDLE